MKQSNPNSVYITAACIVSFLVGYYCFYHENILATKDVLTTVRSSVATLAEEETVVKATTSTKFEELSTQDSVANARKTDADKPFFQRCLSTKHKGFEGWSCGTNPSCYGDPSDINTCTKLAKLCHRAANECACQSTEAGYEELSANHCSQLHRKVYSGKMGLECYDASPRGKCKDSRESQTIRDSLNKLIGAKGTLLLIGDSTLRYQLGYLCKCIAKEWCTAPGVKGGAMKRVRVCGATNKKLDEKTQDVLILFDEIAGGSYHKPWTNPGNRFQGIFDRVNKIVDLSQRGKLVVYTNFAALHLLYLHTVGHGWDEKFGHGTDFQGFMMARNRLLIDYHNWTSAGASAFLVMTPHWVCAEKLPGSMQPYVRPDLDAVKYETAIQHCIDFLSGQRLYPSWGNYSTESDKTDKDRRNLCYRAQLSEPPREPGGSLYLRQIWLDEIQALRKKGTKNIDWVDTYNITKEFGCEDTPDGRHYSDAAVHRELEEMIVAIERVIDS